MSNRSFKNWLHEQIQAVLAKPMAPAPFILYWPWGLGYLDFWPEWWHRTQAMVQSPGGLSYMTVGGNGGGRSIRRETVFRLWRPWGLGYLDFWRKVVASLGCDEYSQLVRKPLVS